MAAAQGILLSCAKEKLVEFGGHIDLNRHWAFSLLKRMNFVKRKATMSKMKCNSMTLLKRKSIRISTLFRVCVHDIKPKLMVNHVLLKHSLL